MKLFIVRDKSSESSRFRVLDEFGECRYIVTGKMTGGVDKLRIQNTSGETLVTIRSVPFLVLRSFTVSDGNERFTITSGDFSALSDLRFFGISWRVVGRGISSFDLVDADSAVIMSHRQVLRSFGKYVLDINLSSRELFCIAVAVCADSVEHREQPRAVTV